MRSGERADHTIDYILRGKVLIKHLTEQLTKKIKNKKKNSAIHLLTTIIP